MLSASSLFLLLLFLDQVCSAHHNPIETFWHASVTQYFFHTTRLFIKVMAEAIDLTGDGGVMKTIVRRAKPDSVSPSETLPLVDGMQLTYLI